MREFVDASGHREFKGNLDVELAIDAMELADHVDQIVLFSGDGSFRSLIEAGEPVKPWLSRTPIRRPPVSSGRAATDSGSAYTSIVMRQIVPHQMRRPTGDRGGGQP